MNYVLDRLDFEEQIVKTIPKENTSKHKCNKKGRRLQRLELRELAPAEADLKKSMIWEVDRRR